MTLEKTYACRTGRSSQQTILSDELRNFEWDFFEAHRLPANHLFASAATMLRLEQSFVLPAGERFGADLMPDGSINMEVNFQIEAHSAYTTVYAINSAIDDEEPLFLIIDPNMVDARVVLKYIPDEDDDIDFPDPTEPEERYKYVHLTPKN